MKQEKQNKKQTGMKVQNLEAKATNNADCLHCD
jgi:hypothetical protein